MLTRETEKKVMEAMTSDFLGQGCPSSWEYDPPETIQGHTCNVLIVPIESTVYLAFNECLND